MNRLRKIKYLHIIAALYLVLEMYFTFLWITYGFIIYLFLLGWDFQFSDIFLWINHIINGVITPEELKYIIYFLIATIKHFSYYFFLILALKKLYQLIKQQKCNNCCLLILIFSLLIQFVVFINTILQILHENINYYWFHFLYGIPNCILYKF